MNEGEKEVLFDVARHRSRHPFCHDDFGAALILDRPLTEQAAVRFINLIDRARRKSLARGADNRSAVRLAR